LQLYGARYRAVRPQGHTLSQSPSRSRSPRGEKCRQHHPLASRAGPTLHWTSKLKQRQKKNDQRTNPTIPTGDRSRKATRGAWGTRHRAGGHGGARDRQEAAGNAIASPINAPRVRRAATLHAGCRGQQKRRRQLVLACVPRRDGSRGIREKRAAGAPRTALLSANANPAGCPCPRLGESVWLLLETADVRASSLANSSVSSS
jgi:hypothetical protein